MQVQNNLDNIRRQIRAAEAQFGRVANSVDLLLVTKGQAVEKIQAAYDFGQKKFGENYLQEALGKIKALKDLAIEWHFIGSIQSNKTREIAEHFSWVHSVASLKIAQRLNAARPSHLQPLNVFLQVNISNEASKDGVSPNELYGLAAAIKPLKRLKLRGLMCLPENLDNFENQFDAFEAVANLQCKLIQQGFELDSLSMGMSQDFSAAIKAGSTMVRIGTAVFGVRG